MSEFEGTVASTLAKIRLRLDELAPTLDEYTRLERTLAALDGEDHEPPPPPPRPRPATESAAVTGDAADALMRQLQQFNVADLAAGLGVSYSTALKYVSRARNRGLVTKHGHARGAYFEAI